MLCQVILIIGMVGGAPYEQHRHTVCSQVSHAVMWEEVSECKQDKSCKVQTTKDTVFTVWSVKPEVR